MPKRARTAILAAAVGLALASATAAEAQTPGVPPVPIPDAGGSVPFEGTNANPRAIKGVKEPPRHPYMAPNGRSNLHNDAYQTDAYRVSGPLGDGSETSTQFVRECASVTFDSRGRVVTICVGLDRPVLAVLDPHSLATLAALPLPERYNPGAADLFTDFSGGGYFYLDQRDRAVVPTNDRRVLVVQVGADASLTPVHEYDLSGAIAPGEGIVSVLPDWSGLLWFVTGDGIVGTIKRSNGAVRIRPLRESVANSFAVDRSGGVFIVSDRALYRFDADRKNRPKRTWRIGYPNDGVRKPGQTDASSGTTPTLMGEKWVAITDNADPIAIRVYRRKQRIKPSKAGQRKRLRRTASRKARLRLKRQWRRTRRPICSEPVFDRGASATDQSLVVAGRAIITENNHGYTGIPATQAGGTTTPGLTRVDVIPRRPAKGKPKKKPTRFDCRTVWESDEHAPSVVPKVSLRDGIVYTYTKDASADMRNPWYLTALDFRTGATVYRRLAGTGLGFNNHYAPVTLGPDGTAYVGVLFGLVAFGR